MTYYRHADAADRVRSAITAAETIVSLDLYPAHKRELLSVCIWKITEAAPVSKYQTRFRSRASLSAPESELAHDHVNQRKSLIDEMIAHPEEVSRILQTAVACVATRSEHERLTGVSRENPDLDGWERYKKAGIDVVDLEALQAEPPNLTLNPGASPAALSLVR
jgi:hypothetical protein